MQDEKDHQERVMTDEFLKSSNSVCTVEIQFHSFLFNW